LEIKINKEMKKKISVGFIALAIAGVAVINMDFGSSSKKESLSAVHLANIEALAQGESGGGSSNWSCWSQEERDMVTGGVAIPALL